MFNTSPSPEISKLRPDHPQILIEDDKENPSVEKPQEPSPHFVVSKYESNMSSSLKGSLGKPPTSP